MQLTAQQYEIIERSRFMERNSVMKIEACAGSGKTFTLTQIAAANPHKRFLYLAFNRAIVESARSKFPQNVTIMTTHALAYRAVVMRFFQGRDIVGMLRPFDIAPLFGKKSNSELMELLRQFNNFLHSSERYTNDQQLLQLISAIEQGAVPMTHGYYLKLYQVMNDKGLNHFDFILLDEAQDTNDVTLSIFFDNTCSKIIVGDSNQSIYGFRGAVNALNKIKADIVHKLSISFRSNQEILDKANYFVKNYARPSIYNQMQAMFDKKTIIGHLYGNEDKAVLTRTNAALIEQIANISNANLGKYNLIKNPRDIFLPSIAIFNLMKGDRDKIAPSEAFIRRFRTVLELETYANECKDREILFAIDMAEKYKGQLFELYERGKKIFNNASAGIVLTNAHQAKGLEWAHVTLCSDFASLAELKARELDLHNSDDNIEYIESQSSLSLVQEANLYYVAMTRAKVDIIDLTDNDSEYIQFMAGRSHKDVLLQKASDIARSEKSMAQSQYKETAHKSRGRKKSASKRR